MTPVVSSGLQFGDIESCIRSARGLDAKIIRLALTPVLCGDRAAWGAKWHELVETARAKLADYAPKAAAHGLTLVIENHQDFTSRELVAFCEEAGPNVGIVYDTGNSFPVAEAPLDFTRVVAPHVRHVHLKDYRVQWTDEGFRLVRCAIGDGAVPLEEIVAMLGEHHESLPAVLEPGALEARHVRLFTPDWWKGYDAEIGGGAGRMPAGDAAQPAARRGGLSHAMGAPGRCGARGLRARHDPAERGEYAGARLDVTGGVTWTRN